MHTLRVVLLGASVATALLKAGSVTAAERSNADDSETAAVRAASAEYLAAVRSNNKDRLLQSWTENGDYIDATGRKLKAHDIINKRAAERRIAARPDVVPAAPSEIRFITPAVAIEDGTYDYGDEGDAKMTGRFTAVWVKQNNRWLLDSLREAISTLPQRDENLRPLEWLVGDWVGVSEDCVMLVSAHWSDRGNYIVRELAVVGDGGEATGTERIGWDAATRQIKSWTFDSQDGRGEGRWKLDGDRWLVETTDVTADGENAKSSAVITPMGGDQFAWEVKSAKVGDQDVAPRRVTFKRASEDE